MKRVRLTLGALLLLTGVPISFTVSSGVEAEDHALRSGAAFRDTLHVPDMIFFPSHRGEVEFPHIEHVDYFDVTCVECHHETNAATLDIPHDEYFEDLWINCELCHRTGETAPVEAIACSDCHQSKPGEIHDETLSSKVVIHQNCWTCHEIETGEDASNMCEDCHSGDRTPLSEPLPGRVEIP